MASYAGRSVVVLASGDPMVSGIGSTLVDLFGPEAVEVLPGVSSVALARARMRWSAESSQVVSLVARDPHLLLRQLAPGHHVLVLSSDETTPAFVAGLLTSYGYGASHVVVLGDLGSAEESRTEGTAATWSAESPRLNVIALELDGPVIGSWAAGLPDDDYGNDGQLTKRDLRAGALARLAPHPGQLLWDVGAGAGRSASSGCAHTRGAGRSRSRPTRTAPRRSGSTRATSASRTSRSCTAAHPPSSPTCPTRTRSSSAAARPSQGCSTTCLARLRPGGRLVVHGVTLETETLLAELYAEHGGELTRHSVERAAPIGSFTGWTPARAVTMWALDTGGRDDHPLRRRGTRCGRPADAPRSHAAVRGRGGALSRHLPRRGIPGPRSADAELVDTQQLDLDQIMAHLLEADRAG